jgi:hypothetical protein
MVYHQGIEPRMYWPDSFGPCVSFFPLSPSRPLHRLVDDCDRLDLDQRLRGVKGRDLDDRVGRIRRGEIATSKLDDLREVGHVPEKDRDSPRYSPLATRRGESPIPFRTPTWCLDRPENRPPPS